MNILLHISYILQKKKMFFFPVFVHLKNLFFYIVKN